MCSEINKVYLISLLVMQNAFLCLILFCHQFSLDCSIIINIQSLFEYCIL